MISFIIPAKNEESYIGDCLRSIMAQVAAEPFEILVVDNNSSDKTAEAAIKVCPSARVFKEPAPGTGAARQKGFLEAQGDWLIFIDADVRLPDKYWLKRVLAKISSQPQLVGLSTHYRYYGLSRLGRLMQTIGTFGFVYPWLFVVNNLFGLTATMVGGMMAIKKSALSMAGGFAEDISFYGDEAALSAKLYKLGKIVVSPHIWVRTSGRRFKKHGQLTSVFKYVLNYFWVLFFGHPYHREDYKQAR